MLAYLSGATLARTADEMSAPALLLLGLAVTGSARLASWLYAGLTAAAVVGGPPLGALLDRTARPGRLLAGALAGYATGLAAITMTIGHVPAALLIAAAAAAGLLAPALSGGWTSRLADVVPPARLRQGHALDAATYNVAGLAGPALAGVTAAAAGAGWAMAAAIVLLLFAAPPAACLPGSGRPVPGSGLPPARVLLHDLRASAAAIARTPALRRITVASSIGYLGFAMFVVACPLLGRRFLGGAAHGALLLSVLAAAALLATAVTARWVPRLRPDTVFAVALAVVCGGLAVLAFAASAAWIAAAVAVIGLADGPQMAAVFAVRQRAAPPGLRSQIFTTAASLKISTGALGAALAGVLAQHSLTALLAASAAAQATALLAYLAVSRSRPREPLAQATDRQPAAGPAGTGHPGGELAG